MALTVSAPFNFAKEEEKVIEYWREIDAFRTSLKLSEGRPEFTFYDGPPFATGLPHYGHLLAGTIKVCAHLCPGYRRILSYAIHRTLLQDMHTQAATMSSVVLAGIPMVCLSSTRSTKSSELRPATMS